MRAVRGLPLLGCLLAACHRQPVVSPSLLPLTAARACPAPRLHRVKWVFAPDSSGLVVALPPRFVESPMVGTSRHFQDGDFGPWMAFGIIRGNLGLAGYRRWYQPEIMRDYTECTDAVNGYQVSIQAWRTPNGVFRDSQRHDRYDFYALWEVQPGAYAYLTGGTESQPMQVTMLAAVRSWRVRKP